MHIEPIRTPADYDAAVSGIEQLMDAVADTPAGDRLWILSILVQAYEDDHWQMEPPAPRDAILFREEQQGFP